MNISFTCNKLANGGAERVISNISNQMAKDGHFVKIICLEKFKDFYYPLEDTVEVVELDKKIATRKNWFRRKIAGVRNFFKLKKAIRGSDIVISFYTRQNCYSIKASRSLKIPIICAERDHFFMFDGKVNRFMRKRYYPKANGFIHQTQMMRDYLREHCGITCKDVVLPNPLWLENIEPRNPEKYHVAALGRLAEQKNYVGMIESFALVHKKIPDAKLHIYGKGEDREKLLKLITELSLEDAVILEGLSNDVSKVLSKAEVFVMFSHGEGYPNALMEALACGVPSVSSDCPVGGPRDMIEDGQNGYLVPCGDKEAFAQRIIDLLQNDEKRAKFAENAIKIRETNKFENIYRQWIDYIQEVVKSS